MNERSLKERMRAGEIILGTHTYIASPSVVEMIGRSGFDWVLIDCEHAPVGPYDGVLIENLLRAAEISGVTPLVRVPDNDETMIMKVLDSGAAGVVIPRVNDAESADRAVRATLYPPSGSRGVCSNTRATGYYSRMKREGYDYYAGANDRVIRVIMVEEIKAVENIEKIVEVEGIDAFYIGPRDLAMTMGEDTHSPRVLDAMAHLTKVVRSKGITVCRPFYYPDLATAASLIEEGATMLSCTSDVRIFFEACSQITTAVEKMRPAPVR